MHARGRSGPLHAVRAWRLRDWGTLRPAVLRVALAYLVFIVGLFALSSVTGWHVGGWFGGVGAGVGSVIGSWLREADHRALSAEQKQRCTQVERAGVASGDRAVDLVALRHLKDQATNHGRFAIGLLILSFAGMIGVFVTAALLRSAWWAVGLLPVVLLAARHVSTWKPPRTYRERRDRLRASLPPLMR